MMIIPDAKAAVGINHGINFQGKLTNPNGTNLANGNYNFVFSLYSAASGGSAIWTESDTLTLTDGIFQINLGPSAAGANTNFANVDFNSDSIYLGIKVGTDAEMSPRVQFTATPYAFNSEKLGGITAAGFAQLNPASAQSGSLNVSGSVQAATSLQAPLVDTATAVALQVGTGTASSVTIGRTTTPFTVQGNTASTFTSTNGASTTTVSFTAPTANRAISFPDAGGTICTTIASTCSATYQTTGNNLAKNSPDTSAFAVTAANYLYGFTNSSAAVASGVLKLDNGSNTGSALTVTASGNAAASQALILANNTNATPSGNLIDLQVNATSKFSVNTSGNLTTSGTITSGLINGQTISATASFTGTVTAVTGFYAPVLSSIDTSAASTNSPAVAFRSGNASGATSGSGNVSVDSGSGTSSTGSVNIGTVNASSLNIGRTGALFAVQGTSSSTLAVGSGANTTTLQFASPSGTTALTFPTGTGTICTTVATTCSSAYLASTNQYIAKNAADTSAASFVGTLLGLSNTNSGAASVLSLTNAGTNAALAITQSSNPSAGQALILANNTNGTPAGNLLDLQVGGVSKLAVSSAGAVTEQGALTVNSGGITVTGNSTITGTLGGLTGLTVASGGASISGGLNVNNSNIMGAGSIAGATTITLNSTISGGTTYTASTAVNAPNFDAASAVGLNIGTGNATSVTIGKTGVGTSTFGISNNNNGITGTGALSNVTNIGLTGTISGGTTYTAGTSVLGPLFDAASVGPLSIGTGNANAITIGKSTTPYTLQGTTGSVITASGGGFTTTVGFTVPTAARSISFPDAGGTLCTTTASTCSGTYLSSSSSFIAKNAADSSSASVAGSLLTFSNTSTGAASALTLNNAGTNAAFSVSQSGNPSAGQAALLVNNSNGTPSGNLLDLQTGGVSKFSVTTGGAVTEAAGLTVTSGGIGVTAGGLTVTAGGTTLSGGLTVTSAASISGGLNNNAGGITNAGAISGATTIALNSTISGGTTYTASVAVQAPSFDTATGVALNIGTGNATSVNLGKAATTTTNNGTLQIGASAGTGALVNNGSTVNTVYAMANLATGGWDAGGAAATVDKYTYISANQTTSGQTLIIPAPTASTSYGRVLYLSNIGTTSFILLGTTTLPGSSAALIWSNTNGGATWSFAGADGSGILNQNSVDQTASFRVTGTGRANTSFVAPLIDSISGGLNLGTSTATGVTIGSTTNTTGITLQGSAGATISIGNAAGSGVLTNNGATLNTTLALGNFVAGGSIGTAAATVNIYTSISVAQTTVGQTLTVPAPTSNTQYGRLVYISNVGTTSFNYSGVRIPPGSTATLIWSNTNGAASWQFAGAGASSIENQNSTSQVADFRINGSGQADTSFLTPTLDVAAAGTLNLGVTSATSISLGKSTITTTNNGTLQIGASAGTGALVNNGSTVNQSLALGNFASGGTLGTSAATVDIYTYISVAQTTASQTLTIPTPTASTTYGRLLYLTNIGTSSFSLLGATIGVGSTATLVWANTNGAASWTYAGADASGILNQNTADQTANFRITGTGRANTSLVTPLVDSISGGLNLGTATATGVTIGSTTNTTGITLQGAAGVTITIGNAAGSGVLTNNGATLNTTLALGNFATGGSIGTAAATVDVYTSISVAQTTVGQNLTIPAPTANTIYGRQLYISNVGTTSFNLSNVRIPPGNTATLIWSNTSGAASWQFAGAGASSIENQNASSQAADFRINGSGRADTSFLTPTLDVASAGTLSIGTTTATGITIGNTTNTTAINLQVTAAGTITLGNLLVVNNSTGIVQIGSSTSNSGTSILALNNNNGTTTPTEVDGGIYYNNSTSQFLCGENGFWVNCGVPPRDHSYDLYDEFMSGNSGSLATGAYGIGGLNWYNSLIGTPGTLTYNNNPTGGNTPAASIDRPGIMDIQQTGIANTSGQTMSLGLGSVQLGTSRIDLKTAVNITGGNLTVLVGLHNETTSNAAPTSGVYWKEAGNGTWQYCYVNATPAEVCANSAVTATAGSWARLEIVIVSSTEIDFYINGTKIAATGITYNTTNKVAPAYSSYKTTGQSGTLDLYIDYFELLGTTSSAR